MFFIILSYQIDNVEQKKILVNVYETQMGIHNFYKLKIYSGLSTLNEYL